jgi:16S rRNA (guanine527-N7)-methyltransferase
MSFRGKIDALYTKHILHSLGIAKIIKFEPGTLSWMGTGGGFLNSIGYSFPETFFSD